MSRADQQKKDGRRTLFLLAYQSLGVVYGDLSISPLYVYKSAFAAEIQHTDANVEIYGVLSLVFWTITLIPLFKYVFIVLRAHDNGEGGTFALYSLICRNANVSLLQNKQLADKELSTYLIENPPERETNCRTKVWLEKNKSMHTALLVVVMLGTGMVIGDGILSPPMSVYSAISGLQLFLSKQHHEYAVVPITCFIIVCLFALQHYGTHRISFLFAPIILAWLICIGGLGIYNIARWNPSIFEALSPYCIFKFLRKTKKSGWMSLGGVLLCITGSEAMFADLGHFSYLSMQIAFTLVVYPALILAYMGQAAYLSKHHVNDSSYQIGFYVYVPEMIRWPVLILAVLAASVGSQAIISCTFSIINQSHSLGCFPRVKVIHTSEKITGRIYIPEINWTLMILCIAVAVGFRDAKHMGNAQGLALITVMLVTTCLTCLVMIICWRRSPLIALSFIFFFGSIEALFFSSSVVKFLDGSWLPIILAFFLTTLMFIWHYVSLKKYEHDLLGTVPLDWLLALGQNVGDARVPGIGLVYTDLVSGVPPNFSRFVANLPAYHRVLVFVCIKYVSVPFVTPAERYLVSRVGPAEHRSYRCIVRYGYRDVRRDANSFESELISSLADFLKREDHCNNFYATQTLDGDDRGLAVVASSSLDEMKPGVAKTVTFDEINETNPWLSDRAREELKDLHEATEVGATFILGRSDIRTKPVSPITKKLALMVYNILKANCRGPEVALRVPPESLFEVGMVYDL